VYYHPGEKEHGGFYASRRRGRPKMYGNKVSPATKAKKAVEVCLHITGLGILSLLAVKQSRIIWAHYTGRLRTKRTAEPALMVTRQVISGEYHENYRKSKRFPSFFTLLTVRRSTNFLYRHT
jgi:hypothetical protein